MKLDIHSTNTLKLLPQKKLGMREPLTQLEGAEKTTNAPRHPRSPGRHFCKGCTQLVYAHKESTGG